jgi:hypothetical protein
MNERIKVASWVCFHFVRLKWPDEYFHPAMLQARHFKAARRQMNRERDLAVSLANIDDWHNLPVWNEAKKDI